MTRRCDNCGAEVPAAQIGDAPGIGVVCCVHCVMNPLGCRCQFGDFGQPQERGPWMDLDDDDEEGQL